MVFEKLYPQFDEISREVNELFKEKCDEIASELLWELENSGEDICSIDPVAYVSDDIKYEAQHLSEKSFKDDALLITALKQDAVKKAAMQANFNRIEGGVALVPDTAKLAYSIVLDAYELWMNGIKDALLRKVRKICSERL